MRSCTRRPIARILCCGLLAAGGARGDVAGQQVVNGTATFDQTGNVTTIRASDGAIINYSQFNVWSNEELHFVQPSSDARVLNRVFGDATHIDGGLFANGIVYIVNPAGIYFGPIAVVDVGGLYAAAGDISNEDFLAKIDRFTLSGVVDNAGQVLSPAVALLGTAVGNHGAIHAPDGTIALVAGEKVLLTQLGAHIAVEVEGNAGSAEAPAIEQTGSVDAGSGSVSFTTGDVYSLAINHTGITTGREIELRAASGTVQVAGTLDASDHGAGATGGSIDVTGERVALVGAQLDASGDAGGGAIRVGGDAHGEGSLPTARRTFVDDGSALRADAIASGDGGRVIVWGDEATAFHGTVSARGGAAGGDGGFAEISGAALAADGDVDLSAPAGATGTLLYDPKDIVLHAGALDGTDAPDASETTLSGASLGQVLFGTPDELTTPFDVYESELESTNANIQLQATNSISSPDAFDVRILDNNSLTMETRNRTDDQVGSALAPGIHLAGVSFQTGGTGGITIATGTEAAVAPAVDPVANLEVANLTTAGGAVSLTTRNGSIQVANVTTSGADGATGGAAGAITIVAVDSDKLGDSNVTVTGQLIARGGTGTAGAGGAGGTVRVRSDGVNDTPFPNGSPAQVVKGGGDLSLADVDTSGGGGTTAGGRGGSVTIVTGDGAISAGDITTSGGDGDATGGQAGTITVSTRDADMQNDNDIALGDLRATGGNGATGAGGAGAAINVQTQRSQQIVDKDDPDNVLQEDVGGGDVTIGSVDVRGGNGGTLGANAGSLTAQARGDGNVLTIGAITAIGGNGAAGNGGRGGNVALLAQDSNLVVDDPITTRGGSGANSANTALGGSGGNITLTTGIEDADTGDVQIQALLDAREGVSANTDGATLATVDGGTISIDSTGSIDQVGTAPLITTTGDVSLAADDDIGQATGELLVRGGDERRTGANGVLLDEDVLTVSAGGTADVASVAGGRFLGALAVTATSDAADIRVTQSGGDEVVMIGSPGQVTVTQVDTVANQVNVAVKFDDPGDDTSDGELVLATGAIRSGRGFDARSDGDIVVGTGDGTVIRTSADPDGDGPLATGSVVLAADQDHDGSGALRAGSDGAVIDMLGDAAEPGELVLFASAGIGAAGDPIKTTGGALLTTYNQPRTADTRPDHEGEFIADPAATTGIYVTNVASASTPTSDLTIARSETFPSFLGAFIESGTGDIEITNEVGDLIVSGRNEVGDPIGLRTIDAKPADLATGGAGGDVRLTVSDPSAEIVLDTPFAIESGGVQVYDGDVVLAQNAALTADAGIDVNGGIDTRDGAATSPGLIATLGDEATDVTPLSVSGGIGTTRALGSFAVRAPDGGDVALDTPLVRTTGSQSYGADLALVQATALESGARIVFDKAGDQSVTGSAGGFTLDAGGSDAAVPSEATIAKPSGNLTLASAGGPVTIGDGDKLSVAGSLAISGSAVRVTDLSALDISVTSPDIQVYARAPGAVATPSGTPVGDGGTDVVANTVAFSSAPTVVGAGPAPRIATPSGAAQNAGTLGVGTLPRSVATADIAAGSRVFDLVIPIPDPGHETQEIPNTPLDPPLGPQPSPDRAGPAAPVSREEVIAFFACAPVADEAALESCAAAPPVAAPAYGSALDTERAVEVARAYRELLGDSPDAAAGRTALARAAEDPRAEIGAASSPAGRAYLTEVARVLGQVRLLGLGPRYREVRTDMLSAVAAAIGSPQLDAARLGKAVDARAMGMPI